MGSLDPLRKISVYRTASRVYAFARTKSRNLWRVLKFSRDSKATELDVVADPHYYSEKECKALLSQINDGNIQHGGLKFVCSVSCLPLEVNRPGRMSDIRGSWAQRRCPVSQHLSPSNDY